MRWTKNTYTNGWSVHWLWSEVYKGVEFHLGHHALSLIYTPRKWKERGW